MATTNLQVNVLTPARVLTRTQAGELQVPSSWGYLGILPGHAPLIAELGMGSLVLRGEATGSKDEAYFIRGGYLHVEDDKVTVLADMAEKGSEIDVKRAEEARKRALDRLSKKEAVDLARAQAALARAEARINVARWR